MAARKKPSPQPAQPKRGRGRPSAFRPEYVEQAEKLCKLGATDVEMADFFGVSINTIGNWAVRHPQFLGVLKLGKEAFDDRMERSLAHRGLGYTYDAVKIFPPKREGGKPVVVPYREHLPPDTAAAFIWLKNRRRAEWRDRQEHELTGKDGGPISLGERLDRAIAKLTEQSG